MLLYDTSADHSTDKCGDDHACHQCDRPPRLKNFGGGENVVLATVGYCLVSHGFGGDGVGDDRAAEGGKDLIDDVADSQCFSVAVAYLPEQQLRDDAGEDEEYDIRQISAHNSADDAVNENCAGLFHLCADDEVDDALKQREEDGHEYDCNRRRIQKRAGEEDNDVDERKQDNGDDVLDFQFVCSCGFHG